MTISDLLPLFEVRKWERCYPGSERHVQDFRTGQNCFFLPVFTVEALAVPRDSSGLHVLARGLLQGGVLTNCGFGTNVRISTSVSTRSGARHWPSSRCPTNTLPMSPWLLQFQTLLIWAQCFLGLCWERLWNFFCFAWVEILASNLCPSSPICFFCYRNAYKSPASSLGPSLFSVVSMGLLLF